MKSTLFFAGVFLAAICALIFIVFMPSAVTAQAVGGLGFLLLVIAAFLVLAPRLMADLRDGLAPSLAGVAIWLIITGALTAFAAQYLVYLQIGVILLVIVGVIMANRSK